jgi:hypothetical protein
LGFFIRYTHGPKIGEPNNSKVFGSKKAKGLNMIARNWLRISYCLMNDDAAVSFVLDQYAELHFDS